MAPGENGGSVTGTGEGGWTREGLQVRVAATIDHLRASSRTDRELTVSGQVTASLDAAGAQVRGALRVDQARIRLPDDAAPKLDEDVVVRNLPPGVSLEPRRGASGRSAGRATGPAAGPERHARSRQRPARAGPRDLDAAGGHRW